VLVDIFSHDHLGPLLIYCSYYERESNENIKYFLSRNLLNTKAMQLLHFSIESPLRSIQVFQRFGSAWIPLAKILLAESAATCALPAGPLHWT